MIDYAFGGENYFTRSDDIQKEIGHHTVYFTFEFESQLHYFFRSTTDPKHVCRCDKDRHFITKLPLDDFRKFLFQEYKIGLNGLAFSEVTERTFRVYGRDNSMEKHPLHVKPREHDEKAVEFLLRLFDQHSTLSEVRKMEEELGIKSSQLKSRPRQQIDITKIETNQKAIVYLKQRLELLMKNHEGSQWAMLGFDTQTFERLTAIQKELNTFIRKRHAIQSQLHAIKSNLSNSKPSITSEFDELVRFFPNTNIKAFEEVEHFHNKIREILGEEMSQEIERLQPLIDHFDAEIHRLQQKIEDSGLVKEMSERSLSQCVNVSKSIDKLEAETVELILQKELQKARAIAEQKLTDLLQQQNEILETIQHTINQRMATINALVTEGQEKAPNLHITPQKEIHFETPGNTSEGAAFKSLVVYDLSILELRPIPAVIHDSNILKRIEDKHLEHILERYQHSDRQIFIAFDKADSITENARTILDETAILRLSDGTELFGRSWSKQESND